MRTTFISLNKHYEHLFRYIKVINDIPIDESQIGLLLTYEKNIKGVWRIPWRIEPTKDVVSCDKPRGAAIGTDPGISE